MSRQDIKSMLLPELKEYFAAIGEKPFRAQQTFLWLHSGVKNFAEMTNLPEDLRIRLSDEFYISTPELLRKQVSESDGSVKYLWGLSDNSAVESVVMKYEYGNTLCVSSQVGCRMGCVFCASTIGGLERNLSASEMEDQLIFSHLDSGERISNIVLMGIGEPLDNFDNVIRFLKLATHPSGMNIGARHISVSTCGVIENIDKLAEYGIQLTLTVSLHAPDDETRSYLMPVNRAGGVDELFNACHRYFGKTGRRISYEYAMIAGVNDSASQAALLAERLKGSGSHLNLIILNEITERPFKPSSSGSIKAFTGILSSSGINYTIRRKLGVDIDASCGQLRRRVLR